MRLYGTTIILFLFLVSCTLALPDASEKISVTNGMTISLTDPQTQMEYTYRFSFVTDENNDYLRYTNVATNRSKLLEKGNCITGVLFDYCLDSVSGTSATLEQLFNFPIIEISESHTPSTIKQGVPVQVDIDVENTGNKDAKDITVVYQPPPYYKIDYDGSFKHIHTKVDSHGQYVNNSLIWDGDIGVDETRTLTFTMIPVKKIDDIVGGGYYEYFNGTDVERFSIDEEDYDITEDYLEIVYNYTNTSIVGESGYFSVNLSNALSIDVPIILEFEIPDFIEITELNPSIQDKGSYLLIDKTIPNRTSRYYDFSYKFISEGNIPIHVFTEIKHENRSVTYTETLPFNISYNGPLVNIELGTLMLIDYNKQDSLDFTITNPVEKSFSNINLTLTSTYMDDITKTISLSSLETEVVSFPLPIETIAERQLHKFTLTMMYMEDGTLVSRAFPYNISIREYEKPPEIILVVNDTNSTDKNSTDDINLTTANQDLLSQLSQGDQLLVLQKNLTLSSSDKLVSLQIMVNVPENATDIFVTLSSDLFAQDVIRNLTDSGYSSVTFSEDITNNLSLIDSSYVDYILSYALNGGQEQIFERTEVFIEHPPEQNQTGKIPPPNTKRNFWIFILIGSLLILIALSVFMFFRVQETKSKLGVKIAKHKLLLAQNKKELEHLIQIVSHHPNGNINKEHLHMIEIIKQELAQEEANLAHMQDKYARMKK